MEVVLRKIHNEDCKKFVLRFAEDKKFFTELSFFPEESILKIDRKNSGTRRAYVHQRRCQINQTNDELKLRIILDKFSAEIFVNNGEQVISTVLYTEQTADGISFAVEGSMEMDLVKYDLI